MSLLDCFLDLFAKIACLGTKLGNDISYKKQRLIIKELMENKTRFARNAKWLHSQSKEENEKFSVTIYTD